MLEVEGEAEARVERAEQQLDQALVARVLERDAHRSEAFSERAHPLAEDVKAAGVVAGELRRELEALGRLRRPAVELLLRRQAVARRVQLDRRKALRVVGEEGSGVRARGVE